MGLNYETQKFCWEVSMFTSKRHSVNIKAISERPQRREHTYFWNTTASSSFE